MPESVEIVEPGRYDYYLTVSFPSVYIPDHTPVQFRNEDAQPTTRRRYVDGQFELTAPLGLQAVRDHFVRQACEDVDPQIVTVRSFELTPVTA